jgi:hypothetical protein
MLEPGLVVLLTIAHMGRAKVMAMPWHRMTEFEPPKFAACLTQSASPIRIEWTTY